MSTLTKLVKKATGADKQPTSDPKAEFHSFQYLRQNQRVQEHLATLGLDLSNKSVLEIGAGIGDHSSFFLDRGCRMVIVEGRAENLKVMQDRFADEPNVELRQVDMDNLPPESPSSPPRTLFDVVYCFGLLYHLSHPAESIEWMARRCKGLLLVETWVSMDQGEAINLVSEDRGSVSQALTGTGCRPTRKWFYNQLKRHLPHVYMPITQPNHIRFPLDWTKREGPAPITRCVFIASRNALQNDLLVEAIPESQTRH